MILLAIHNQNPFLVILTVQITLVLIGTPLRTTTLTDVVAVATTSPDAPIQTKPIDVCPQYTDCKSCSLHPECGYCAYSGGDRRFGSCQNVNTQRCPNWEGSWIRQEEECAEVNDVCENYSTSCQTCSEAPKELNCGFYALGDQTGDLSQACMTGSPHGPDHLPTAIYGAWGWGELACQSNEVKCNQFSHTNCSTCLSSNLRCSWSESTGSCQSSSSPTSIMDGVNHLLQCLRITPPVQVGNDSNTTASPLLVVTSNTTILTTSSSSIIPSVTLTHFFFLLVLFIILIGLCGGIRGRASYKDETMQEEGQRDTLLPPSSSSRHDQERPKPSNEGHRLSMTIMVISLTIKAAALLVHDWGASDSVSLLARISFILSCLFGAIAIVLGLKNMHQSDSFGIIQLLVCTACWTFICTCGSKAYWSTVAHAHSHFFLLGVFILDFFILFWAHNLWRQAQLHLRTRQRYQPPIRTVATSTDKLTTDTAEPNGNACIGRGSSSEDADRSSHRIPRNSHDPVQVMDDRLVIQIDPPPKDVTATSTTIRANLHLIARCT